MDNHYADGAAFLVDPGLKLYEGHSIWINRDFMTISPCDESRRSTSFHPRFKFELLGSRRIIASMAAARDNCAVSTYVSSDTYVVGSLETVHGYAAIDVPPEENGDGIVNFEAQVQVVADLVHLTIEGSFSGKRIRDLWDADGNAISRDLRFSRFAINARFRIPDIPNLVSRMDSTIEQWMNSFLAKYSRPVINR
jgi:hypothetical protein